MGSIFGFGDSDENSKIRFAVVGLGHIAQAAVLPAFQHATEETALSALVSGDSRKLKELGDKYGVHNRCGYDEYDSLLESGDIDAVYIALPNDMHCDFTLRAAERGIHVLCEKPMAMTEGECHLMVDACRRNGVQLMIAYRLHFEEANLKAIDLVNSGKLGDPRYFESAFSLQVREQNIRTREDCGGGPLFDIGIYCINAARYIFRSEPTEVMAMAGRTTDNRFKEVDEAIAVIMRFPGERLATFTASFGAADVSSYRVAGTKGDLVVSPAYDYSMPLRHLITINGRKKEEVFNKRDQFAPELLHFAQCIHNGDEPLPSGEQGLADVRIIEAINHSAATKMVVPIFPIHQSKRPNLSYEIRRQPVRQPALVHAQESSR